MAPDDNDLAAKRTLLAVRREIDAIDDAMHDLLMKRAALVVERVVSAKARDGGRDGGPLFRGGREASILRRLVGRNRPPLPADVVVRIWREIICALTRVQGPFAVAVYAPGARAGYGDLARDHFGPAPLQPATSVASALAALERGRAQLAVLPLPEDGDDPWWRGLGAGPDSRRPSSALHILARLPFLAAPRAALPQALVVGRQHFDPSGDDRGYLLIETEDEISRARLRTALEGAGLAPLGLPASAEEKLGRGRMLHLQLVETAAWVPADDQRFKRVAAALGPGTGLRSLGGYAQPIALSAAKRK
jgi:chorismate mutase